MPIKQLELPLNVDKLWDKIKRYGIEEDKCNNNNKPNKYFKVYI